MTNKAIQRSRMWKYFIEATVEIIETEGIHQVTIRKVADRAGYNSATIYNYFNEQSHLIFFASMKMLKSYVEDVTTNMARGQNSYEKYMLAWECMCKHSFEKPYPAREMISPVPDNTYKGFCVKAQILTEGRQKSIRFTDITNDVSSVSNNTSEILEISLRIDKFGISLIGDNKNLEGRKEK